VEYHTVKNNTNILSFLFLIISKLQVIDIVYCISINSTMDIFFPFSHGACHDLRSIL